MKHNVGKYDEHLYSKILNGESLKNQDFMFNEIFDLVKANEYIDSDFPDNNVNVLMNRFLESLNLKIEPHFFYIVKMDNKKVILTKKFIHYLKFEMYDESVVSKLKKQYRQKEIEL